MKCSYCNKPAIRAWVGVATYNKGIVIYSCYDGHYPTGASFTPPAFEEIEVNELDELDVWRRRHIG